MRPIRFFPALCSGLLLMCTLSQPATFAADKLYRWVDAQGHAHFSDQPHDNAKPFDPHLPNTRSEQKSGADHNSTDAKACSERKADLARYRKATSITETDSLGKVHTYSDAERKQLIDRTQAAVASACGQPQDEPGGDAPAEDSGGY